MTSTEEQTLKSQLRLVRDFVRTHQDVLPSRLFIDRSDPGFVDLNNCKAIKGGRDLWSASSFTILLDDDQECVLNSQIQIKTYRLYEMRREYERQSKIRLANWIRDHWDQALSQLVEKVVQGKWLPDDLNTADRARSIVKEIVGSSSDSMVMS